MMDPQVLPSPTFSTALSRTTFTVFPFPMRPPPRGELGPHAEVNDPNSFPTAGLMSLSLPPSPSLSWIVRSNNLVLFSAFFRNIPRWFFSPKVNDIRVGLISVGRPVSHCLSFSPDLSIALYPLPPSFSPFLVAPGASTLQHFTSVEPTFRTLPAE